MIMPGNEWLFPYMANYRLMLGERGAAFDLIYWDKDGSGGEGIAFAEPMDSRCGAASKLIRYLRFSRFVRRKIVEGGYRRLIFLTPLAAMFMPRFLNKHYRGRCWIDYRDMSFELRLRPLLDRALKAAACVAVSSPSYASVLGLDNPPLFHNINIESLASALHSPLEIKPFGNPIRIANIGFIRHSACQRRLIDEFGNRSGYELIFAGEGESVDELKEYVRERRFDNVSFTGRYDKRNEYELFREADFIYARQSETRNLSCAMTNRFYGALLAGRPMIASPGIQAEYVNKYSLGLSVGDDQSLFEAVSSYEFKPSEYAKGRMELLRVIQSDMVRVREEFNRFIES